MSIPQAIYGWITQSAVNVYNTAVGWIRTTSHEKEDSEDEDSVGEETGQLPETNRSQFTSATQRRMRIQNDGEDIEEVSDDANLRYQPSLARSASPPSFFTARQPPTSSSVISARRSSAGSSGPSLPTSTGLSISQPSTVPAASGPSTGHLSGNQPESYFDYICIIAIGLHAFSGTSFIAAAFALKEGGWFSYVILIAIAVASYYNASYLGSCLNSQSHGYEDVAAVAYPRVGYRLAVALTTLLSFATCVGALMVEKDNFQHITTETVGVILTIGVVIVLFIAICKYNIREENPYIPALGVVCMVIAVVCLLIIGSSYLHFNNETTVVFGSRMHISFGFYAYFYSGHSCLPVIFVLIKQKNNYRKVVIIILVASTILYGGIASVGYSIFGSDVKQSFTTNLPLNVKWSYIAIFCSVVNQAIAYLLNMASVLRKSDTLIPEEWVNRHRYRFILKILLVLVSVIFIIVDSMVDQLYVKIISLTGAIIGVLLALIIPMLCFLQIRPTNLSPLHRRIIYMLVTFGFLGASFTVFQSIRDML